MELQETEQSEAKWKIPEKVGLGNYSGQLSNQANLLGITEEPSWFGVLALYFLPLVHSRGTATFGKLIKEAIDPAGTRVG